MWTTMHNTDSIPNKSPAETAGLLLGVVLPTVLGVCVGGALGVPRASADCDRTRVLLLERTSVDAEDPQGRTVEDGR